MSEQCVEGILEELALVKEQRNRILDILEDSNATGVELIRQRDETKKQRDKAEQQRDKLLEALKDVMGCIENGHDVTLEIKYKADAIIAEVEADK